jgi:hypothetical protein
LTVTLVDYVVGGGWDAAYHTTQPFDGFFSPPHIFIYALIAVLMVLVWKMVRDEEVNRCFPPGALLLLVGGCLGFALAGPLDATWHTAFGLDETEWSLPHAMIGQALGLLAVGFLTCRRGLDWYRPTWAVTRYLMGFLVVFAAITVLGPLIDNPTAQTAELGGSVGALANDADYQRLVQMIVKFDLTHSNPAFPLLAAWWCAFTLATLRGLDGRVRYWFVVTLLVGLSLAGGAADEAAQLRLAADGPAGTALPLLTALLLFSLTWWLREQWRYALAGLAVGLHAWSVWGSSGWYALAVLATPLGALGGMRLGRWVAELVLQPSVERARVLVVGMILVLPVITGGVDLWLRLA